jgi:hypothetical protein
MRPDLIPRHLAICENRKKGIGSAVDESPAILRERRWAGGIIREDIRQHRPCHPPCFLPAVPTHMLQCMSEGGNETDTVRRLPCKVGISLRAGETEDKEKLQGLRQAPPGSNTRPCRPPEPGSSFCGLGRMRPTGW